MKNIFIDLDGTILEIKGKDGKMNIDWDDPDIFKDKRIIKVYADAIRKYLKSQKEEINIMFLSCGANQNQEQHKINKLATVKELSLNHNYKSISGFMDSEIAVLKSGANKADTMLRYHMWKELTESHILIDDNIDILCDWENKGGKAIHISQLVE